MLPIAWTCSLSRGQTQRRPPDYGESADGVRDGKRLGELSVAHRVGGLFRNNTVGIVMEAEPIAVDQDCAVLKKCSKIELRRGACVEAADVAEGDGRPLAFPGTRTP
jgi:hypothetical protein